MLRVRGARHARRLERGRLEVIAGGLLEPAVGLEARAHLGQLGAECARARRRAAGAVRQEHRGEQRFVDRHFGGEPIARRRRAATPSTSGSVRTRVHARRDEAREPTRRSGAAPARAHHEERRQARRARRARRRARRTGRCGRSPGMHSIANAAAQQQAARHHREQEAEQSVLGREPQPEQAGEQRNPGLSGPANVG